MASRRPPYWQRWQSGRDRLWRWRFVAPNNEIIAISEGYATKAGCFKAMDTMHRYMQAWSSIDIKDIADPYR